MKIQIQRSALLEALKKVQGIAPGKCALAILQNVMFETGDGKVILTTSDLDITMRAEAICEVEEAGATTIPVKLLSTAVGKLSEGSVSITVNSADKADVISGNVRFKFSGLAASEFPQLPIVNEGAKKYVIKAKDMKEMLGKVCYAASQDETRRALKGVYIIIKDGKTTAVATDGRRLAVVSRSFDIGNGSELSVILPKNTVGALMSELGGDGDVEIVMGGSQIVFRLDGMDIYSRVTDGTYPNYSQVIPKSTEYEIPIDRISLLESLDRVSVLAGTTDAKSVKFCFADGRLTISTNTADVGEAFDELAVKYDGPKMEIMFNPSYMMDALKAIVDDDISFNINNGHSPAVIKDTNDFIYVLMPLRIC